MKLTMASGIRTHNGRVRPNTRGQVEASTAMEDAIEERFPEVVLKVVADFLVD